MSTACIWFFVLSKTISTGAEKQFGKHVGFAKQPIDNPTIGTPRAFASATFVAFTHGRYQAASRSHQLPALR